MYKLDIDKINRVAPYKLELTAKGNHIVFATDNDVEYHVSFEEEPNFHSVEAYYFGFSKKNDRKSPADIKVVLTLTAIIKNFLDENHSCVLYICETGDGKQNSRARLFEIWFRRYASPLVYGLLATTVTDEEGVDNFIGLLYETKNPKSPDIMREFADTVEFFSNKPE